MSHIARLVDAYGNLTITQSSSTLIWNSRSTIQSTADGYITLQNNAGTNFSALRFGGVTSSFPSLYNNGAALEARLADGSAYTNINLNILNAMGQGTPASPAIRIGGNATGVLGFYSPGVINNTFQALGISQNGAGILTLDTLGGGLQYNSIGAAGGGHFFYSNGGSAAFISSSFLDVFGTVSALRFRAAGGSAIGGTTTQYGWTNASTGNSGSLDTAITRNAAGVITITTGSGQTPTGTLIVAAGTTTTPGVAVGTTSNGVYAPTTNQIAITTNNTQAMLWDASQNTTIPSGSSFMWNARSKIVSSADGYITLQNNAGTGFSGLLLGGTTSSFPAIYTNGSTLEFRLADGSAYSNFNASNITLSNSLNFTGGSQIQFTGTHVFESDGASIYIRPQATNGGTFFFTGSPDAERFRITTAYSAFSHRISVGQVIASSGNVFDAYGVNSGDYTNAYFRNNGGLTASGVQLLLGTPGHIYALRNTTTNIFDIYDATNNATRFSIATNGISTFNNAVYTQDGSVSSPGLAFASETGTGLYRPTTGQIALSVLGQRSLLIDNSANANILIGATSSTTATNAAIALGYRAAANGNQSIGIGYFVSVSNANSIGIGNQPLEGVGTGIQNIMIGTSSTVTGSGSTNGIAIGSSATVAATQGIAIGPSSGLGNSQTGVGNGAIAIGVSSSAAGTHGIAIGNAADGYNYTQVIAIGDGATAAGGNSIAIGTQSGFSTAIANATGNQNIAIGHIAGINTSSVTNSIAIGSSANVGGNSSVALGVSATTSTFTTSVAIGNSATATANNQIMLGTSTETVVVPGNIQLKTVLAAINLVTTTYTILNTDGYYTVKLDATPGTFTITLPSASTNTGRVLVFKKMDAVNPIAVTPATGQTIDGANTYTLSTQYQSITVQSDGSNWIII